MRGLDISENNGIVDFKAIKDAGNDFVIIRLGYGNKHLDSLFFDNVNGAIDAGLKIGVYYYDYGLDTDDAVNQAIFMLDVLQESGLTPERLAMGLWYDMEDADSWKARNGMPDRNTITAMCSAFIVECNKRGYSCGIYASLDWLEHRIATEQLASYVPYWVAQWGERCDYKNATLWQYTDSYELNGRYFDANYKM